MLWAAVGVLVVAGLLPLASVLGGTFVVDGHVTLAFYRTVLATPHQRALLGRSVTLAGSTALAATLVGLPLGLLFARTDLPLRRTLAALSAIPLVVPPYVMAMSWFHLVGRGSWLAAHVGPAAARASSSWLFSSPGAVLVLTTTFLPVVTLLTMAFSRTVDPDLEDAARLVTDGRRVVWGVTLPLIMPGVLLGAALVFLLSLGEFGVPMFLRYDVFAVESFTRFAAFYDPRAATAAAVPLVFVAFVAVGLERVFLRERTYRFRPAVREAPAPACPLGRLRGAVFGAVALVLFVMVALPLLVLLVASRSPHTYVDALARSGDALLRSVGLAAAGATALTLVGFLTGYLIQERALGVWRSVDTLTVLLFALPGTVLGIGLVTVWNRPATAFVYATPLIIVLGYVARYAVIGSRATVSALAAIPASMDEAARLAGAGWLRRITGITVPLAARGLLVVWVLSFLFCFRDLGITMMVYPPGGDTLPVRTFTLMANGSPPLIASLSVIMVAVGLLPLGLAGLLLRRGGRGGVTRPLPACSGGSPGERPT